MTPSPKTTHQRISRRLGIKMATFVDSAEVGEIFIAPFDVVLDKENVVQPDILFISKSRSDIIGENNVQGPPDLVVEILSESSAYRDAIQKKMLYARHGVGEYWIVAPGERFIEVYLLKEREYTLVKTYHDDETIESTVIPGLKIALREILVP
jgi:Uma2 family endonuclease